MNLTTCSNCGSQIKTEDVFCGNCGSENIKKQTLSSQFSSISSTELKKSGQKSIDEIKSHVEIIAIIEIVFGIFTLFVGVILVPVTLFLPMLILDGSTIDGDAGFVAGFFFMILAVFTVLLLVYGLVQVIYGRRLKDYKKSAKTVTMIVGALNLPSIPIGTAFGLYALYILTKPEIDQILVN